MQKSKFLPQYLPGPFYTMGAQNMHSGTEISKYIVCLISVFSTVSCFDLYWALEHHSNVKTIVYYLDDFYMLGYPRNLHSRSANVTFIAELSGVYIIPCVIRTSRIILNARFGFLCMQLP